MKTWRRPWLQAIPTLPIAHCPLPIRSRQTSSLPNLAKTRPAPRGLLSIRGMVNPPGFQQYVVEYGDGDNPGEWKWISGPHLSPIVNDQLTQWGIDRLPAGRYTIRVTVNTAGGQVVGYTRFDVGP